MVAKPQVGQKNIMHDEHFSVKSIITSKNILFLELRLCFTILYN